MSIKSKAATILLALSALTTAGSVSALDWNPDPDANKTVYCVVHFCLSEMDDDECTGKLKRELKIVTKSYCDKIGGTPFDTPPELPNDGTVEETF